MSTIGRYVKMQAQEGRGDALAAKLLEVASGMDGAEGCELYLVNRAEDDPDAVWVTEVWRRREDADAALATEEAKRSIEEVRGLLAGAPEVVHLTPAGGHGLGAATAPAADGEAPFTHVPLSGVEDVAAKHGFGEQGEARFANEALGTRATGISLQRLNPDRRQMFGHRHEAAEEVYVVLRGSGRMKLDDEVVELAEGDAIRVAPPVARAFEAGPDGLEVLAVGPRHQGDGEVLMGWWSAG